MSLSCLTLYINVNHGACARVLHVSGRTYSSLPTLGHASEEAHFEHGKIRSVLLLSIYISTLGAVASSANIIVLFHAIELKAVGSALHDTLVRA